MRTRKKEAKQRGCRNIGKKKKKKKKDEKRKKIVIIPRSISRGIFYICPKKTRKRGNYWTYETYDCAFVSVEYQRHCFRFGNERRPQPRSSSSVLSKKRENTKRERELQSRLLRWREKKNKERRNATMCVSYDVQETKKKGIRKKNLTRRPTGSRSDTETAEKDSYESYEGYLDSQNRLAS